jgi:uncharacterized protein
MNGTAVITGASSGIGAMYADRLAKRGYDAVLIGRDEARLRSVSRHIAEGTGRSATVVVADLTDKRDLLRVEQLLRTETSITMLVNNAGIAIIGELADADPDRLEQMIALNVLAPSRLALAVLPAFIARGGGTIINISSAVALAPEVVGGSYSGTKAYLLNLSLRLQQETSAKGVRVQVVLPGAVRTAIWEKAGTDINSLPPENVMDAEDLVDAALAGLDQGETVTIPSLPDAAKWHAYDAARQALLPGLSRKAPAPRYRAVAANA